MQDLQRPEAPDLGQAQKCGGVKHVFEISTLPYTSSQCRKVHGLVKRWRRTLFYHNDTPDKYKQ